MTEERANDDGGEDLHRGAPKVRHCLRCRHSFKSEWAGERICARCKASNAWRSGIPVRSTSAGRG